MVLQIETAMWTLHINVGHVATDPFASTHRTTTTKRPPHGRTRSKSAVDRAMHARSVDPVGVPNPAVQGCHTFGLAANYSGQSGRFGGLQMKYSKVFVAAILALVLSSCSLGGGDDTELSASEGVTPEPTANNVQPLPAATAVPAVAAAAAPLPTAITLPPTQVPPTPTADRSQPTTYVVQNGDVLGLIAERYDVDVAELRRVNGLSGNLIKVGQQLTIPAAVPAAAASSTTASAAPAAAPTAPPRPTTPPAPVSCPAGSVGHCVQSGDSLLGIASKYGVSVDAVRAANPSISGDLIRIGDVIALPGGSGSTTTTTTTTTTGSSTAGSGTTIEQIVPTVEVGPTNDADCKARNFEYPYFHAADGLCYANPFNATVTPVAQNAGANDAVCPAGTFKWEDGLCYPIPGYVAPTAEATATPNRDASTVNYGTVPCRDGYVALTNGRCWPVADNTNPTTVTPVP